MKMKKKEKKHQNSTWAGPLKSTATCFLSLHGLAPLPRTGSATAAWGPAVGIVPSPSRSHELDPGIRVDVAGRPTNSVAHVDSARAVHQTIADLAACSDSEFGRHLGINPKPLGFRYPTTAVWHAHGVVGDSLTGQTTPPRPQDCARALASGKVLGCVLNRSP